MGYGIMWKTVSEDCNLACDYCYYSRVRGRPAGIHRPAADVLSAVLGDYLATCGPYASIAWQGGEPTLAGLPFFHRVVALETRLAHPPQVISNAFQTNGVLLTEAWARFFKQYRFLVGVSLDGPEDIHDARRVDAAGHGTWTRVMRGIAHLEAAQVAFNILTVVGPHNVRAGPRLIEFYLEHGFSWVQFLPEMGFHSQESDRPGTYAITPVEYGTFLCETFDAWWATGRRLSVRYFDNVLYTYLGLTPEACTLRTECPPYLIVEANGDIYPCDFYLGTTWRLGNIRDLSLRDALATERYRRFQHLKHAALPDRCRSCRWQAHCHGGCPRNRVSAPDDPRNWDYFCDAYQMFYEHAGPRLERWAAEMERTRHRLRHPF